MVKKGILQQVVNETRRLTSGHRTGSKRDRKVHNRTGEVIWPRRVGCLPQSMSHLATPFQHE